MKTSGRVYGIKEVLFGMSAMGYWFRLLDRCEIVNEYLIYYRSASDNKSSDFIIED